MSYFTGTPSFVPSSSVAMENRASLDRNAPEFRPVLGKESSDSAKFRVDAPEFRPSVSSTTEPAMSDVTSAQASMYRAESASSFHPSIPSPEYMAQSQSFLPSTDAPAFPSGQFSEVYDREKEDPYAPMAIAGPEVRAKPARRTWKSLFVGESMYSFFREDTMARLAQVSSNDPRYKEIPPQYSSMFPLDKRATPGTSGSLGYVTSLYKVVDTTDGHVYALRRCDKVSMPARTIETVLGVWGGELHPSVIPLRSIFVYQRALFFVHDFVPGARSVADLFLHSRGPLAPDALLWRILSQAAVALRTVHSKRLSFRGLRPESILLVGRRRVLIANAGVMATLEHQTDIDFSRAQRHDLQSLGMILLAIACRTPLAHKNVEASLDFIRNNYSADLAKIIHILLAEPITSFDLVQALAPYIATELDAKLEESFALESALSQEAENGRLMRLLIKMGYINERPEHLGDPMWSETGERYLLKLFRDYVFHQIDDEGKPILDVAHVIESLNKLDVGDPQTIVLSSRDKEDVLIPTFAEIRRCMNQAFSDLRKARSTRDTSAQHKRHSRVAQRAAMTGINKGPGFANLVLSQGGHDDMQPQPQPQQQQAPHFVPSAYEPSNPHMMHAASMGMRGSDVAPPMSYPLFTPSAAVRPGAEGPSGRSRLSLPPGGQVEEFVPGNYNYR